MGLDRGINVKKYRHQWYIDVLVSTYSGDAKYVIVK